MKKLLGLVLALCLLLGCTAALADPITLTYAEVNPVEGTIVGELAKAFKNQGGRALRRLRADRHPGQRRAGL